MNYVFNHIFFSQLFILIIFQCAIFLCFQNIYLSTMLKSKFDHTAETVLTTLMNLISNSAKVLQHCKKLAGCNTELVRLQYSIARLQYRIGKVAIQNWQADKTVLQGCKYSIGKVTIPLLTHLSKLEGMLCVSISSKTVMTKMIICTNDTSVEEQKRTTKQSTTKNS